MTEDLSKAIARSAQLFMEQVKPHLLKEWKGEIVSIEEQSENPLAEIFDRGAASDVILSYFKTQGPILTIASRIGFCKSEAGKKRPGAFDTDFTLRCSYITPEGNIGFDCELEKLLRAANCLKQSIPVVMPFYYVRARMLQTEGEPDTLYDFAVVETQRLLEVIVDPARLNWHEAKNQISTSCEPIELFRGRRVAGIEFTKADKRGFVYIKLEYLEECGVPYFYKRVFGDQSRLNGSLFVGPPGDETSSPVVEEPKSEQVTVAPSQTRTTRRL